MSFTILFDMFAGTDYLKMGMLLNQMAEMPMEGPGSSHNMERSFVKMLLNLGQSPHERGIVDSADSSDSSESEEDLFCLLLVLFLSQLSADALSTLVTLLIQ